MTNPTGPTPGVRQTSPDEENPRPRSRPTNPAHATVLPADNRGGGEETNAKEKHKWTSEN
jgi:hypothetical protein